MDLGIAGKVALVTGAARNLGRADALKLAEEGCRVAVVDLNKDGAGETAEEIRRRGGQALAVECDIADRAAVKGAVERIARVEPYVPGSFYQRELPCILQVLSRVDVPLEVIVVDGYVWLDAAGAPGLGAHLWLALERRVAVVGVAKTTLRGSPHAVPVRRGASARPLSVTAAGVDVDEAARAVASMHGAHRIPTLLKRVDRLCRDAPSA